MEPLITGTPIVLKQYLVFGWNTNPDGGWSDYRNTADTYDRAYKMAIAAGLLGPGFICQIVDTGSGTISKPSAPVSSIGPGPYSIYAGKDAPKDVFLGDVLMSNQAVYLDAYRKACIVYDDYDWLIVADDNTNEYTWVKQYTTPNPDPIPVATP